MPKTSDANRPGHPDGPHPLGVLGLLAGLFGAGVLGWALLAGAVWLVWLVRLYVAVGLAVLVAGATVTLAAWMLVRGNWRGRALGAGLFVGVVAFVLWVWSM